MWWCIAKFPGIEVSTPNGKMTARAILLLSSMDLPARAYALRMKKFNGQHGCLYYYHPGVTTPSNHLHRFWPMRHATLRTHTSFVEDGKTAHRDGKPVRNCSLIFYYLLKPGVLCNM